MRQILIPILLGFGVTLALVIGQRMTTDMVQTVEWLFVGAIASVPLTVLLVARWQRSQRGRP